MALAINIHELINGKVIEWERLEFKNGWNPGRLDYRNRRVVDFLKDLHLTEGRGTGIPTIYKTMEKNGSPNPIIETNEQSHYFLTILPINTDSLNDNASDQVSNHVSNHVSNQVSNQVIFILKACLTSKSRSEILELLGLSNHSVNFNRHIKPLIENGLIQRTVPENPRDRNQKYITTELGKQII